MVPSYTSYKVILILVIVTSHKLYNLVPFDDQMIKTI